MRTDDIIMPNGHGISNYSTGLYMPSRMKAEEMTKGEAAKLAGHARWVNAEKTMKKYPEEVETEKRRLQHHGQE